MNNNPTGLFTYGTLRSRNVFNSVVPWRTKRLEIPAYKAVIFGYKMLNLGNRYAGITPTNDPKDCVQGVFYDLRFVDIVDYAAILADLDIYESTDTGLYKRITVVATVDTPENQETTSAYAYEVGDLANCKEHPYAQKGNLRVYQW